MRRKLTLALLVWVGTATVLLAVYWPALKGTRLLDDDLLIYDNVNLRDASGLWRTWVQPESSPDFYPLTYSTWWVEQQLADLEPWLLHVDNILLHAASVTMLGLLLRRIGFGAQVAWLAAALFALHPVQVESVAWMSQRKTTLSGLCFILAAYGFVRGALNGSSESPPQAEAARSDRHGGLRRTKSAAGGAASLETPEAARAVPAFHSGWYAFSLLMFACAMLSKPVTMTLAGSLLLLVWMCRGSMPARRESSLILPYFALALPMAVLTTLIQRTQVLTAGPDFELGALDRTLIAGRVFWFYLWKLAVPFDLVFAYPRWVIDEAKLVQLAVAPISAACVLLAVWLLRKRITNGPWLALAFFVITLSPALGFFPIYWHLYYYVADHVQYLAMIGPCLFVAAFLGRWIAPRGALAEVSRGGTTVSAGRWLRWPLTALALGVVAMLAGRSAALAGEYRDGITLWEATLSRNPDALIAYRSLSKLYAARGNEIGDVRSLQRALDLAAAGLERGETFPEIHLAISAANLGLGRFEAAAEAARTALRLNELATPAKRSVQPARAYYNLGTALLNLCRIKNPATESHAIQAIEAEATASLERAVELEPELADGWFNLGSHHLRMGRYDESVRASQMALKARPTYAAAMTNLGIALSAKGDSAGARRAWEESIRMSPTGESADVARQGLASLNTGAHPVR